MHELPRFLPDVPVLQQLYRLPQLQHNDFFLQVVYQRVHRLQHQVLRRKYSMHALRGYLLLLRWPLGRGLPVLPIAALPAEWAVRHDLLLRPI